MNKKSIPLYYCSCVFPSYCYGFCDYSSYVLTTDNLEMGIIDKREHMAFVFLSLGCITQYTVSISIHLPANFIVLFKGRGK